MIKMRRITNFKKKDRLPEVKNHASFLKLGKEIKEDNCHNHFFKNLVY